MSQCLDRCRTCELRNELAQNATSASSSLLSVSVSRLNTADISPISAVGSANSPFSDTRRSSCAMSLSLSSSAYDTLRAAVVKAVGSLRRLLGDSFGPANTFAARANSSVRSISDALWFAQQHAHSANCKRAETMPAAAESCAEHQAD